MTRTSYIELNEEACRHNIEFLRKQLNGVKISSVIKGNAYGHGIAQFVQMANRAGMDHFSVFSSDEACEVHRHMTPKSEIMIMGYIADEDLEWVVANDIGFFVFDIRRLEMAIEMAKKLQKMARVHIELETGFNRTGVGMDILEQVAGICIAHPDQIAVDGVCTHYAGAESITNHVRVVEQIAAYNRMLDMLIGWGIRPKYRHTACSAAAFLYPETRMDMCRIGIMQYGFWPSREALIHFISRNRLDTRQDPLKRVITWKSVVMSTKEIHTGEFIGYGTSYLAEQETRIATVPVGYSHGYSRVLSNQGRVLIRGHRLGVIGVVNMNLMLVDITECPDIQPGDTVTLIGQAGDKQITVASFGELSNQLNYELLVRIPHNIPRYILEQPLF